ncbi:SCP2 sterol-binding domain-containing protein [Psittacicella gerlachiana]|uniref:SCP2 sterol-binding domain-containing protein n=1 Tax=Psittacicella gerlachiana TaxID=2028574 RepID=UPI001CA72039|nr:SCP2 sterol-binding domain-containing protein [Psittacicella gerlachiana]
MSLITLIVNALKNNTINEKLIAFVNKTLEFIVPQNLKGTTDYLNLKDKNIYLEISDLNLIYQLKFADKVEVEQLKNSEPLSSDLLIKLTRPSIISLVNKTQDFETLLKQEKLKIEGDNKLLISLINFTSRVDFSVENVLSKYIGDVPAYIATNAGKKANEFLTNLITFIDDANVNRFSNKSLDSDDPFRDDSQVKASNVNNPIADLIENKLPNAKQVFDSFIKQIK